HGCVGGGVAAVVEVANGDALNAGNREGSLKVLTSTNAGADGGKANGITRCNRARGIECTWLENRLGDCSSDDRAGTDLHELAAGQGIFGHGSFRPHKVLK